MDVHRKYQYLNPDRIEEVAEELARRIRTRFPEAGLSKLCKKLVLVAAEAKERTAWIDKPIISVRIATWSLTVLIAVGLLTTVFNLHLPESGFPLTDFVQLLEAGINDIVLIGAGIFFLLTIEVRIKRRKALRAIHELRAIAHIIDMHQMTKDPQFLLTGRKSTDCEPAHQMTPFELSRYLDYCSEMLSLVGKIAAVYVQEFDDGVALAAVNEVEDLTTGLSGKVWQKLVILHEMRRELEEKAALESGKENGERETQPAV